MQRCIVVVFLDLVARLAQYHGDHLLLILGHRRRLLSPANQGRQ